MADLSVSCMGLELKNPLIVSSSSLTNTVSQYQNSFSFKVSSSGLKSLSPLQGISFLPYLSL